MQKADNNRQSVERLRVLLIGGGGREHAIAGKLRTSPHLESLYVWPGNPSLNRLATPLDLPREASFEKLIAAAQSHNIQLVFCGPEKPLADGLADAFLAVGIPVFGPRKAAAQLESSKSFAKQIMKDAGIPTADFIIAETREACRSAALRMLAEEGGVVLKASGLAAGKGVFVCRSIAQVDEGLARLYSDAMREAAATVVIEKLLLGRECSYFVFLGRGQPTSIGFAVDYKRLRDGDDGPNTGGMGCYAPVPWLPENAGPQVDSAVVQPLIRTLRARGIEYTGCLYVGLMWGAKGPQVVEFNVRLGDPEAQVLAVWDSRDWLQLAAAKAGLNGFDKAPLPLTRNRRAVAVVMASSGYPYGEKPDVKAVVPWRVFDAPRTAATGQVQVFGASVAGAPDGSIDGVLTGSGRVFTVVAVDESFRHARAAAYQRVAMIRDYWPDCQFRTDIADDVGDQRTSSGGTAGHD